MKMGLARYNAGHALIASREALTHAKVILEVPA